MRKVFDIRTYKKWRIEHDKLTEEDLAIILYLSSYPRLDGLDADFCRKKGFIILDDWCIDVE